MIFCFVCQKYESLRADFDAKRSQLGDDFFINNNNNNNGDLHKHSIRLYDDIHYLAIRFIRFYSYSMDKERLVSKIRILDSRFLK